MNFSRDRSQLKTMRIGELVGVEDNVFSLYCQKLLVGPPIFRKNLTAPPKVTLVRKYPNFKQEGGGGVTLEGGFMEFRVPTFLGRGRKRAPTAFAKKSRFLRTKIFLQVAGWTWIRKIPSSMLCPSCAVWYARLRSGQRKKASFRNSALKSPPFSIGNKDQGQEGIFFSLGANIILSFLYLVAICMLCMLVQASFFRQREF